MKKVYNVSYDLNKAGKDYKGLHEELKKTPDWYHLLDSTWLLATTESPTQIWNRLNCHIDADDRLLIVQVVNNKSGWLSKGAWEWLNFHISQPVN